MRLASSSLVFALLALALPAANYTVTVIDRDNIRAVYVDGRDIRVFEDFFIQASTEVNVSAIHVSHVSRSIPMAVVQQGANLALQRTTLEATTIGYTPFTFDPPVPMRAGDIVGWAFNTDDPLDIKMVLYGTVPVTSGQQFH